MIIEQNSNNRGDKDNYREVEQLGIPTNKYDGLGCNTEGEGKNLAESSEITEIKNEGKDKTHSQGADASQETDAEEISGIDEDDLTFTSTSCIVERNGLSISGDESRKSGEDNDNRDNHEYNTDDVVDGVNTPKGSDGG